MAAETLSESGASGWRDAASASRALTSEVPGTARRTSAIAWIEGRLGAAATRADVCTSWAAARRGSDPRPTAKRDMARGAVCHVIQTLLDPER